MRFKTLCGCLSFSEAEYRHGFTGVRVKAHYKAHPECAKKAREDSVWRMRESPKGKDDIGDEHDSFYDNPVQQSGI